MSVFSFLSALIMPVELSLEYLKWLCLVRFVRQLYTRLKDY